MKLKLTVTVILLRNIKTTVKKHKRWTLSEKISAHLFSSFILVHTLTGLPFPTCLLNALVPALLPLYLHHPSMACSVS